MHALTPWFWSPGRSAEIESLNNFATHAAVLLILDIMIGPRARSPVAGVVHALVLVAVVLAAAPLARYVPLPTLAAVLFVVASFAVAGGVADRLTTGGFADPSSESERAASILEQQFHAKDPNIVLLVTAKDGGRVSDPAVAAAGSQITSELAATHGLEQVASYWSLGNAPPLSSKGGHQANGKTEVLVTGDDATKITAAAEAAVPGATAQRVETDAEGAAYEVHMTKADGSIVTVKLDSSFKVRFIPSR